MKNHFKAYGVVLYLLEEEDIKILLCKSVRSKERWGCLKGLKEKDETAYQCAKREFYEESSIDVDVALFEDYFEQKNKEKDIGVWIVNANNVDNLDEMFFEYKLKENHLSWENAKVKFFSIYDLPLIKKKQEKLISKIKDSLKNTNPHH